MLKGRWNRMNAHRKKVFAAGLAVAVACTSFNVASFAVNAEGSKDPGVITAFEELEDDVAYQYLPVGAHESDIEFPIDLKVKVYSPKENPEEPVPEEPDNPTPDEPENPESEVSADEPEVTPDNPAPEEPAPEEPSPEEPAVPEVVSENEAPEDQELSGAIKNIFGAKTVYAAEPEEKPSSQGEGTTGEPGSEEGQVSDNAENPEQKEPEEEESEETPSPQEEDTMVSDNEETPAESEETPHPSAPQTPSPQGEGGDTQEKILTNVKWKLLKDESSYSRFEALLDGDVFIYEPDMSRYPLEVEAALPRIKVTITGAEEGVSENETVSEEGVSENGLTPAFSRMMISGGVRIKVEAGEGVFPENAEIRVKKIDDPASAEKIKNTVGASANVAAFDISIVDAEGNEIQPDTEHGTVTVTFENVNIVKESAANLGAQVSVYHFEDGFENGEKLETTVDAEEGSAAVEAEHFSPFVVVVDGEPEEAAGDITVNNYIDYAIEKGLVKINGINSGKPAVPAGPIFESISESVDSIPELGGNYKLRFGIGDGKEGVGEIQTSRTGISERNYDFQISGYNNRPVRKGYPIRVILAEQNSTSGIKSKLFYPYPKYPAYAISLNFTPANPLVFDYDKSEHTVSGDITGNFVIYRDDKNTDEFGKVEIGNNLIKNNHYTIAYSYYRMNDTERDSDGEYILPAGSAIPGKDGHQYTEVTEVKDGGVYAVIAKMNLDFKKVDIHSSDLLKIFNNTVSADAGGSDATWVVNAGEGVFFQIKRKSVSEAFAPGMVSVSTGGVYKKDGHKIFKFPDDFGTLPDISDASEKVKYTATDSNGKVITGYVSDDPVLKDPGTYTISINAIDATNYKGTYPVAQKLTITKRSLSSGRAALTISPNHIIIKDGGNIDPLTPPVTVTWKNEDGSIDVLKEGTDYTLKYSDNTKAGTGKVSANGIGGYEGVLSGSFDISTSATIPTVLYRGDHEAEASEKPKEWYRTGVRFSGKKDGDVTYKTKVGNQSEYKDESDSYKEEGKDREVNVFLKPVSGSAVYDVPVHVNIDLTAPTGTIKVENASYTGLKNDGKVDFYVNKNKDVTAYGDDELSGVTDFKYYVTDVSSPKSAAALLKLDESEWRAYAGEEGVPMVENKNNFIYIRVKDKAGNIGFASAPGVCYDTKPPVLDKVEAKTVNNSTSLSFAASDELSGVSKYYVLVKKPADAEPASDEVLKGKAYDKQPVDLGKITGTAVIYCVVTDRAGNVSTVQKVSLSNDTTSPTGTINVMSKTWNSVQEQGKIVGYTREKQVITITGKDPDSGVKKIEYYITPKFYSTAASIQSISSNLWKTYNKDQKPEIEHNVLNYVYAKITDGSGNIGYVSTEGIWHDTIKPVITKATSSKPTDKSVTVSITGEDKESGIDCYYAIAKKTTEDAPKAKDVESGGTKNTESTFDITGLTAGTDYKVYGIIKDKCGNLSDVKSQAFATKKAASSNSSKKNSGSSSKKSGSSDKKNDSKNQNKNKDKDKNKNGASQNGAAGSTSKNGLSSDAAGATGTPFIDNASEGIAIGQAQTAGWNRITDESVKASEPSQIFVQMNGETVVPADLLKSIKDKNITVYFEMNDDFIWAVNGKSLESDPEKDVDLGVRKDTKNIPAQLIDKAAGLYPHFTISLAQQGDYGFKAGLSVPFTSDDVGMFANLYYYNEQGDRLDFVNAVEVKNDGRAEFEFTHASDYLLILRQDALTEDAMVTRGDELEGEAMGESIIKPRYTVADFFTKNNKNLWLLAVTLLSLALCGFVMFFPDEKKRAGAKA